MNTIVTALLLALPVSGIPLPNSSPNFFLRSQCYAGIGRQYIGNVSVTLQNRTCKPWIELLSSPYQRYRYMGYIAFIEKKYDENPAHSKCRNPDESSSYTQPFCNIADAGQIPQFQYCRVPNCDTYFRYRKSRHCYRHDGHFYAGLIDHAVSDGANSGPSATSLFIGGNTQLKSASNTYDCVAWTRTLYMNDTVPDYSEMMDALISLDGTADHSFCRNTNNLFGYRSPWCFISKFTKEGFHEHRACDVARCESACTDGICKNNATCTNDRYGFRCNCHSGFGGEDCSYRICPEGRFGSNCQLKCHCANDTRKGIPVCGPMGHCFYGCERGFMGPTCQRCDVGFYNFSSCLPCECASTECDPDTGCHSCPHARHGVTCERPCYCRDNSTCLPFTGICEDGCDGRFYGKHCDMVAPYFKLNPMIGTPQASSIILEWKPWSEGACCGGSGSVTTYRIFYLEQKIMNFFPTEMDVPGNQTRYELKDLDLGRNVTFSIAVGFDYHGETIFGPKTGDIWATTCDKPTWSKHLFIRLKAANDKTCNLMKPRCNAQLLVIDGYFQSNCHGTNRYYATMVGKSGDEELRYYEGSSAMTFFFENVKRCVPLNLTVVATNMVNLNATFQQRTVLGPQSICPVLLKHNRGTIASSNKANDTIYIIIGVCAGISAIVLFIIVFCCCRKAKKKEESKSPAGSSQINSVVQSHSSSRDSRSVRSVTHDQRRPHHYIQARKSTSESHSSVTRSRSSIPYSDSRSEDPYETDSTFEQRRPPLYRSIDPTPTYQRAYYEQEGIVLEPYIEPGRRFVRPPRRVDGSVERQSDLRHEGRTNPGYIVTPHPVYVDEFSDS